MDAEATRRFGASEPGADKGVLRRLGGMAIAPPRVRTHRRTDRSTGTWIGTAHNAKCVAADGVKNSAGAAVPIDELLPEQPPSLTPLWHIRLKLAAEIAGRGIVADEHVLAAAGGDTAADLGRRTPDHLREVARAGGEAARSEVVLVHLIVPALDLDIRRKGAGRTHGQVLAEPVVGVAEIAGIRPLLGGGGELCAPGERGHAMLCPQLIVLVEGHLGEIAALARGASGRAGLWLSFAPRRLGLRRLSRPASSPDRQHDCRLIARGHDDAEAVLLPVEDGEVVAGEGLNRARGPRGNRHHRQLPTLEVVLSSAQVDPVDVKLRCTGILECEGELLRAVGRSHLAAQLAAGTGPGIG